MKNLLFFAVILFFAGCGGNKERDAKNAAEAINEKDFGHVISVVASDDLQGRKPSTLGEERTISYLKDTFTKLGLKPGNGNSYFQEVPLEEITTTTESPILIKGKGKITALKYFDDFIGGSPRFSNSISIKNAGLIFAGYGIVAPEYNWNDYAGINVKDKIVVVLVNDPGYATGDSSLFNGKAMTYYGRWTYKYEEAARQGAAGVIIIHETGAAAYPWAVVQNSWKGAKFDLVSPEGNASKCKFEGWVTSDKAEEIFQQAGLNYDETISSAAKNGFKAFNLGLKTSISMENKFRRSISHNVAGLLPGKDKADEYIIYTAHWDHFGMDTTITSGDNIYNGALDNASGVASIIEIATAFTKLAERPSRSILFLSVTAEEQGLLGSEYYAQHPIYPLSKTVANINIDGVNIFGKTKDITVVGYGNSDLDDYVVEEAKNQGRIVRPDPYPEKGGYYRSDHFSFAKVGVPSLDTKSGVENIEHGTEWMMQKQENWIKNYYHKPADNYEPGWWNLSGAVEDTRLLFEIGYKLSNENTFPNWKPGNEFRARRDAMMGIGK
jgi:Zn-dependent M28 family amino/carboxypeptidase